jgi:hypothetical protein
MKGSLLLVVGFVLAFSSNLPANAAGKRSDGCNENTWRPISGEPCPTIKQTTYTDCIAEYKRLGWRGSEREWCDAAEPPKQLRPAAH